VKITRDAKLLIERLLDLDPETRITVEAIFEFPWVRRCAENFGINISEYRIKQRKASTGSDSVQPMGSGGLRDRFSRNHKDSRGKLCFSFPPIPETGNES
jgi:serine/threonine protein kinase